MIVAVITGARGMDASYLADFLIDKVDLVVGIERRSSSPNYNNIQHLLDHPKYILEQGDITDFGSIARIIKEYSPSYFFNLAAMSFVHASWSQPSATCDVNFTGTCNCLEAIRLFAPKCRFLQASTSEVYGDAISLDKQNEKTQARPRSVYGASKYGAESLVKVYKDSYNMFACYVRSFNHTGARRGIQFVEQKIASAIGDMFKIVDQYMTEQPNYEGFTSTAQAFETCIKKGIIKPIKLGNIEAKRDFSHAKDIVRGMWLVINAENPDNYVLASGDTISIRDLIQKMFAYLDILDYEKYISYDVKMERPADVQYLCGDSSKIRKALGWKPQYDLDYIVKEMLDFKINKQLEYA